MKENQRVAVTRRMLQEGLMRLLQDKHIDSIKVTELCAASGINRATFYRYYHSPRDVLDQMRREILTGIHDLVPAAGGAWDPLQYLTAICRYFYDRKKQMQTLFRYRTDEGFIQLLNQFTQERLDALERMDRPVQIDPTDLKLASCYYAGGAFYILRQWLTEDIDRTPEQIARLMYRFITAKVDA